MHALAAVQKRIRICLCCFIAFAVLVMGLLFVRWVTWPAQAVSPDAVLVFMAGGAA